VKTYTIHRGTVRSNKALFTHRLGIYDRQDRARDALALATHGLIEAEKHTAGVDELVVKHGSDGLYGQAIKYAKQEEAARSLELRAAQAEIKAASARANEASKMHLVEFVAPYVPVKSSRVHPALKTCTSPRRAARAKQRALIASYCSHQSMPDHPARGGHDYLRTPRASCRPQHVGPRGGL